MKIRTILISSFALSALTGVAMAGPGAWAHVDTNGDGQLTQSEVQAAAAARIQAADTNGDGAASPEELKAHFEAKWAEKKAAGFAKKDTNGDGALSKDEMPRMPDELFNKLDTDGNGSLTQEELSAKRGKSAKRQAHGKSHDPAVKAERLAKRFAKLDKNGDGSVTREEVPKMPDARFKGIDANGDGALSMDEFNAARQAKGHGKKGKGMLRGADTNADGKVDVAEAQAAAARHFSKLDKNGDGVVTQDEMHFRGKGGGFKGRGKGAPSPAQ